MAPQTALPKTPIPSKDLWAFAHDALEHGGNRGALEARAAAKTCMGFLSSADRLAIFFSGGTSDVPGPLTQERQMAFAEMTARCSGFANVGGETSRRFLAEASNALARVDNGRSFAEDGAPVSTRQIVELLASGAPSAMAEAAQLTYPHWQSAMGIGDDDPRAGAIARAVVLASCDLGEDCSAAGDGALSACIFAALCSAPLHADPGTALSEQENAIIAEYRQRFVRAVTTRNWSSLGLVPVD